MIESTLLSDFQKAVKRLRRSEHVVVGSHTNPDGDAFGSVLGLTLALREAGIDAIPTFADTEQTPTTYDFLPGTALFVPYIEIESPDVFVALDTPSLSRLNGAEDLARSASSIVVFDHHPDNSRFGEINIVQPDKAATAQLVWEFLAVLDIRPTSDIALCCYTGLITDTGRFTYSNTTAQAVRAAAEMIDAGVDAAEAARLIYQEKTLASLELEAKVLSRLTFANHGKVAYSWCTDEDFRVTDALMSDAEGLPDVIRRIRGVEVVALLRIGGEEIKGNLRSKTGFDVSSVARRFGGGGHILAAGFTFIGSLDQLVHRLMPLLPGGESGP